MLVTALLGVEDSTVPSPVKVTLVTVPPPPEGVIQAPCAPQTCPDVPPGGQVTTWLFALLELVHGVPPFRVSELNEAPLFDADPKPRSFSMYIGVIPATRNGSEMVSVPLPVTPLITITKYGPVNDGALTVAVTTPVAAVLTVALP